MTPDRIIVHHSATQDSGTVSWDAIRRYHTEDKKWLDIGYHFGIEYTKDANDAKGSYEILMGRMPDAQGAHAEGMNYRSIGICCVGNYDEVEPPQEMIDQLKKLLRFLCRHYRIPFGEIHGHNEYSTKTCPGTKFPLDRIKRELALDL